MKKRALILKGGLPDQESTAYATYEAMKKLAGGIDWHIHSYDELEFFINTPRTDILIHPSGRSLADFDLVYIRDFRGYEHERNTCAYFLKHHKKRFINSDTANFQHISKLSQMFALDLVGVPVPASIYSRKPIIDPAAISRLGDRVIVKDIVGVGGSDNHLLSSDIVSDFLGVNSSKRYIVQEYIPNEYDLRITVLGDRVGTVAKRTRGEKEDHRNNVKQGAKKEFLSQDSVRSTILADCIAAARVLNREIAGVDVVVDASTGRYAILEVNLNFGMESVQNIPPETLPMAGYFKNLLGG